MVLSHRFFLVRVDLKSLYEKLKSFNSTQLDNDTLQHRGEKDPNNNKTLSPLSTILVIESNAYTVLLINPSTNRYLSTNQNQSHTKYKSMCAYCCLHVLYKHVVSVYIDDTMANNEKINKMLLKQKTTY